MVRHRLRKRAFICPLAALAISGLTDSAFGTNLLINPGFESPTVAGSTSSVATGWTFYADAQRATFANNTSGGKWSDWVKSFEPAGGVTQSVSNITGGTNYNLSAYIYFEAGYNQSGTNLDLMLTWNTGSPSVLNIPAASVTSSTFTPYLLSATAPVGATSVVVSFDWTGGTVVQGMAQSGFLDDADLEGAGSPPTTAIWAFAGSGDWNVSGNWSTGAVPNGPGQEADFAGIITANQNVYTDIAITAGILNFNNAHTYVIDGAGSLTLQAVTGNAQVIVQAGTQEINVPTTIASNTVFNVSSGTALIIADPITISSGKSLTTVGSGSVTYRSIVTVQTGASFAIASSTHAAALNLQGTATTTLAAHTGSSPTDLQLDSLTLGGSTNNWTSKLNITNNEIIVHNGSLTNTTNQIKQGLGGSTGIVSSTAALDTTHLTTIGVIQNDNGAGSAIYTSFGEVTGLTSTDVLVKYTYYGDANIDGKVDGSDYSRIDNGFLTHASGWLNGDFNYDGNIDGSDYTLIDNVFNRQGAALPSTALATLNASSTAQIASVPEPATVSVVALGLTGLLTKRSRKRSPLEEAG